MNFPNDQSNPETIKLYNDYCEFLNKQEIIENKFKDNVKTYKYKLIGKDIIRVDLELAAISDRYDTLFLAYDEDTNVEEIIKNWYNSTLDNNIDENLSENEDTDINTEIDENNMNDTDTTTNNKSNSSTTTSSNNSNNNDYTNNNNNNNNNANQPTTETTEDTIREVSVAVSGKYLKKLANINPDDCEDDYLNISIKINGVSVCNGKFNTDTHLWDTNVFYVGTYTGKTDNFNFDIIVEGKKITQEVNYSYKEGYMEIKGLDENI